MNARELLPAPDAIPVAWGWMEFFLLLTFIAHILLMNMMLGALGISLVERFRRRQSGQRATIEGETYRRTPIMMALTINLGVAPLLFLQVLYGRFFYVSSILMAVFWLAVPGILLLAYYGMYRGKFHVERSGAVPFYLQAGILFGLLLSAFFFSHNVTLMQHPENWFIYFRAPGGMNLDFSDGSLLPRYLHFIVASFAAGGLFLAYSSRREGDAPGARQRFRRYMRWFAWSTVAQMCVGVIFFLALPARVTRGIITLASPPGWVFVLAVLFAGISVFFGFREKLFPAVVFLVLTVILMAVTREFARRAYLSEYFSPETFKITGDSTPLGIFIAIFAAGITAVIYMLRIAGGAEKGGKA